MASPNQSRRSRVIEGMAIWGSYYRENIDIFVEEYLQLDFLKWFQTALLVMMDRSRTFLWIAARGMGKSFLIAIFVVIRCILYPGTKVVITSGTRGQSINVLEKIQTELMPVSPNLRNEIDMGDTKFSGQDAKIMFKNSSYIKVVTASDNARSNRANILIVDEFRMVKKDTIDTVLKKFLTSRRMPPYRDLTPAERKAEYAKEPNKSCFLSSAYFKDHWSYNKMLDTFKLMLDDSKTDFVCGFPYQLSIQEGLLFPEDVESDMLESDFNEIKWSMEMEAMWFGAEDGSFFDFDSISKNRRINYPMLPDKLTALLGNSQKVKIPPKQNGERRILSADIALMSSKKHNNDASAVFINQMLPTKTGRFMSNIVYGDTFEGMHTEDQALVIRKLYDEYSCDYIVLDCTGLGLGVYDALVRDMVDPDTGEVYPALSCCNNQEMADRCTTKGADKTKQEVLELVLYHDTMIEPTPRTVRKWLHKLGERRFSQFLDVRMADILAHAEGTQESRIERCIALGSIMSEVLEAEQCFALKDLQINGRDIMNLGIEQGKRVGEILNSLLDEVISGALENEHNALMQRAVELLG